MLLVLFLVDEYTKIKSKKHLSTLMTNVTACTRFVFVYADCIQMTCEIYNTDQNWLYSYTFI